MSSELIFSPTYMFDLYKKVFLEYYGAGKLEASLTFKNEGKMNPAGLMCDIWGRMTGRGSWFGDGFRYKLPVTDAMTFVTINMPKVIVDDFLNPNKTNCPVANFLTKGTLSNPKAVADFLLTVQDNDINSGPLFRYKVSYTREFSGVTIGGNVKVIDAPCIVDARTFLLSLFPDAEINSVIFEQRLK